MSRHLDPVTFPIHGRRLIEASAGTGKTYTIGALYLRLVLGHGGRNGFKRPLAPPEILVVTFTNAATEELRDRIRQKLVAAAAHFDGADAGDDFLKHLRLSYPQSAWPEMANLLEQAALWMDEAAIHTIHGWCSRMLRQHAFLCGNLFDLELAPDDDSLLEEAACDYWRSHLYKLPPNQLGEVVSLLKLKEPLDLMTRVKTILSQDLVPEKNPFELLEERHQAILAARTAWSQDLITAVDIIRTAKHQKILNGRKYSEAFLKKGIDQLTRWVGEKGPLPDMQILERFSLKGLTKGTNKDTSPPFHSAYEAFDRLNTVLSRIDINKPFLAHAAREIHARYERQKALQRIVDFDDLPNRLNQALHGPGNEKLAQLIADQYPVAMIDEFQDTDPVQYALFSRVYGHRPQTALLMIGDPKQAIYGFRGADIHTYLRAREDTGENPHTLDANYRATKALVTSVNQIFGFASNHPDGPFLFNDRIPFEPVLPKGPEGELVIMDRPSSGVHIRQMPQTAPVPKTGPHGYLAKMAEDFADQIATLLHLAQQTPSKAGFRNTPGEQLLPLHPADVAVLVRSGTEADLIRRALGKRGVKSVYLSDKASVFDSFEAVQMLYLLRACASPGVERTLKAALASPILALPFDYLDSLNRSEAAWEREIERFGEYCFVWQTRGVLPMLRKVLQDFGTLSSLLTTSGGERAATNYLHLAELLQEKSLEKDGPQGLITWLEEQLEQHPKGPSEQILRLESDEDLIKVITIHKSKGLQYPLVFLPFICTFRQITQKDVVMDTRSDETSGNGLMLDPHMTDVEAADRERLAEDLRLLYVAITRAQYACWMGIGVTGSNPKSGEKSELNLSGFGYLLSGGRTLPTPDLSNRLRQLKGDCPHITISMIPDPPKNVHYRPAAKPESLSPARPFDTPVFRDWWITSYSGILKAPNLHLPHKWEIMEQKRGFEFIGSALADRLREPGEPPFPYPEPEIAEPSIHNFPRGPEPGTFLHALLEWAADKGFDEASRDPSLIRDQIEMRMTRTEWRIWTDPLTEWFQKLLQTPFPLPKGEGHFRLKDLSRDHCRSELEFLFAARGMDISLLDHVLTRGILSGLPRPPLKKGRIHGMLKGFIDLVFKFRGRFYVLDYKSNHLGENTQDYASGPMARAMLAHRYDLQYALYTLALHRLLKARLPRYDYERDMGGAVYLFLRGVDEHHNGVYLDRPPKTLIEQLDRLFKGKEESR